MKILVCDDDREIVEAVTIYLEKEGYSVLAAYNGKEALDTLRREQVQLIILDIMMPLLSGLDTAKELRSKDAHTPIIFLTSSKEYAIYSYEVHALHYLLKPVSKEQLFDTMNYFLEVSRQSEQYFSAQTANGFCKLRISDIEYLEAMNKQVNVHMTNSSANVNNFSHRRLAFSNVTEAILCICATSNSLQKIQSSPVIR